MALTKSDCLTLLNELKEQGISCDKQITELLSSKQPSTDIIKYINQNKQLDCRSFYEQLRRSYNDKKSKLYINIVRQEDLSPKELLCCLASLNLQILLYNKKVEKSRIFLRQMRFEELQKVLLSYAVTGDIVPSQKLLELYKADLKVLEHLAEE